MKLSTPLVIGGVAVAALLLYSSSSSATPSQRAQTRTPQAPPLSGPLPPAPETFGLMTTTQAQQFLTGLAKFENQPAFDPGGIDGAWGPKTAQALANYQDSRGLEPDAKLGPKTYAMMQDDAKFYLSPEPTPAPPPAPVQVVELDNVYAVPARPMT